MQLRCTCPPYIDTIAQLCDSCRQAYETWIENEWWESRTEAAILPPDALEVN